MCERCINSGFLGQPMQNVNFIKRPYYRYLGIVYRLIHWTDTRRILGVRYSSLIRLLLLALPIVGWIQNWNWLAVVFTLLIFLWIQYSYWRSRRTGYYRFVGEDTGLLATANIDPLQPDKPIPGCATGVFSLKDWEKNVIFRPASYWQVPLGDHAVMVEHEPGRYLYQFFSAKLMQDLQKGWLLYGSQPNPALSISFLSSWGPEFSEENISLRGKNKNKPAEKLRTIYLSFENKESEEAVWHNLLYDARRVRSQ